MWPQHGPKTGYGKEMWPQMNGMYGKNGKSNAYFLQLKEYQFEDLEPKTCSLDVRSGKLMGMKRGKTRWAGEMKMNEKGQVHKQKEQRKYHLLYSYLQYLIFWWTWLFYRFKLFLFCFKRCIQASNRLDSVYSLQVTAVIKCGYSMLQCNSMLPLQSRKSNRCFFWFIEFMQKDFASDAVKWEDTEGCFVHQFL